MIKIFAAGDFHGEFSEKMIARIKKESPDLIFSPGDFCGNRKLGKIFFKYFYGKSEEEIGFVPEKIKREYTRLEKSALQAGLIVVKKLKSLNIPAYAIRGNWDPAPFGHDMPTKLDREDKKKVKKFEKLQNKVFQFVDLRALEFENFILIGGASSTSPIGIKKDKVLKQEWNFRQKNYEQCFEKARKINKPVIFLTHNCPYKTKLDIIKKGPKKGKHYGSYQEMLLIKKYQPCLVICGHMHENFGEDKIGKSRIINCGSAMEGKFKVLKM